MIAVKGAPVSEGEIVMEGVHIAPPEMGPTLIKEEPKDNP